MFMDAIPEMQNPKEENSLATNNTSPEPVPQGDVSLIEKADSIAKRIEEGNKKFEELVARQEAAIAKSMLAGRASAGQPQKTPQQLDEEKIEEELKALKLRFS